MTFHRPITVLSVLRVHPLFRRLWVGALLSGLGDVLSSLALPWYVLDQTGRGDLVGALLLCFALPALVTGPLWGQAMDRFQPRRLMLFDNGARAIVFLLIPALTFVLMAWSLLTMPNIPRGREPALQGDRAPKAPRWPAIVRATLGLTTLFYFVYGPFEVALPVFARATLTADALSYGLLWSALGVGTLFGSVLVSVLSRNGRLQGVLAWIMALWGSVMVLLAFTSNIPFALAVMLLGGVIWGPYTALETTLLQRSVPAHTYGRLLGLRTMLLGPAAPLGTAIGGLLLVSMSANRVLVLSGLACVLGAAVAWPWMRGRPVQPVAEPEYEAR